MTWEQEHRECAESLGAYALGAVPEPEAALVGAHLERCARCRTELASLEPAVRLIPGSVDQVGPSPELKSRVMSVVTAEAELLAAAGAGADRVPAPREPRRRWFGRSWRGAGLVAAALAVGVIAGTQVLKDDSGPQGRSIQAGVLSAAPQAKAWLRVRGARMSLVVQGLPDPPGDRVYQVWIQRASRTPESADALFSVRSGEVQIPREARRGDRVMVTPEPRGGSLTPTAQPIIDVTNT
jgi:hypothetical protein